MTARGQRPPPGSDPASAIPVSLITGFLGSGKTTLLNQLLASTGMSRTAVLINEFGEVGIDHLIVREIDAGAVLLKSGCICCTVQGEMVDGLKELYMKRLAGLLPPFERVVIETTGLADPLPIISCLMRDPLFKHVYRLEGLLTTVDALHGEAQLDRHAEAVRQAAVADRLVITKTDLVPAEAVTGLERRLGQLNPRARIITAIHGAVDPAQLLDCDMFDPGSRPKDVRKWLQDGPAPAPHAHAHGSGHHHEAAVNVNRHDQHIVSHCITLDEPVSLEAFRRWYDQFAERRADHLLRVKGILDVRGEDRPYIVHCVQATQHTPSSLPAWPTQDRRSQIVFITSELPGREIEASLRGYLAQWKEEATQPPSPRGAAPGRGIWLNDAQLTRIFSALAGQDDWIAGNALRLMLLTGASRDEVRTARWEEFDLDARVWRKRAAKGRGRRIALGDAALLLIGEMQGESEAPAGLVFTSGTAEISAARIEKVWCKAARAAGIEAASLDEFRPVLAANLFKGLPSALTRRLLGLAIPGVARRSDVPDAS